MSPGGPDAPERTPGAARTSPSPTARRPAVPARIRPQRRIADPDRRRGGRRRDRWRPAADDDREPVAARRRQAELRHADRPQGHRAARCAASPRRSISSRARSPRPARRRSRRWCSTASAAASTRPPSAASSTRTATARSPASSPSPAKASRCRIEEPGPWAVATRIADEVVSGKTYNPVVAEAVNYHAAYVAPLLGRLPQARRPHRAAHLLRHARRRELGARRAERPRRPALSRGTPSRFGQRRRHIAAMTSSSSSDFRAHRRQPVRLGDRARKSAFPRTR